MATYLATGLVIAGFFFFLILSIFFSAFNVLLYLRHPFVFF